jgi:hypothetical protein
MRATSLGFHMTNPAALPQFCAVARRKGALVLYLALCTLGLGVSASDHKPTINTFDAPGAGTFITDISGINPAGAITGDYFDASLVYHGFLRAPEGTFTTFDAPGAGTGTFPSRLTPAGGDRGILP